MMDCKVWYRSVELSCRTCNNNLFRFPQRYVLKYFYQYLWSSQECRCRKSFVHKIKNPFNASRIDRLVDREVRIGIICHHYGKCSQSRKTLYDLFYPLFWKIEECVVIEFGTWWETNMSVQNSIMSEWFSVRVLSGKRCVARQLSNSQHKVVQCYFQGMPWVSNLEINPSFLDLDLITVCATSSSSFRIRVRASVFTRRGCYPSTHPSFFFRRVYKASRVTQVGGLPYLCARVPWQAG